jgi:exodeoxyribonuclease-3
MKLISWNVNGLRAVHRNGFFLPFIEKTNPDILCLQETKSFDHQLPEEILKIKGYFSYFASSQTKKGYSGVALYTKIEPKKVEYGIGIPRFDEEGRVLVAYFDEFILLNVYFPNGGQGPVRLQYKYDFYDAFLGFIDVLSKKEGKIIFCGDVNTAHQAIDLARPKENEKNTGFLPEERSWIDKVITHGYADTFRYFHSDEKDVYSYWDTKTRARERNVGWRIDYFFANIKLFSKIKSANILPDIYGSDHCPITLEL